MRFLTSLLLAAMCTAAPRVNYHVASDKPSSWPTVLATIGLQGSPEDEADVLVLRPGAPASPKLADRVEKGLLLVIEGPSPAGEMFGFRIGKGLVRVRNVEEARQPSLAIIWESELELSRFEIPHGSTLFAKERWTGAPLVAGFRRGKGAVLWVSADPGARGYERFPFLPHALADLGFTAPIHSNGLWAFFDSSYRLRADPEYLAKRWRSAGIDAIHVAAWHYYEPDKVRDEYLEGLIRVCHQNAILVYAWLELPHVSEKFWTDHPEWREKTADLADAHLDWRKLMNLADPQCAGAVKSGIKDLISRFDWDGVNLAELYFESLEGAANPSRFTPMNATVRSEFQSIEKIDPVELFREGRDPGKLRLFLDFRSSLARRIQEEWLNNLEGIRQSKPHLDMVLTHVDDHLDGKMRDSIGADSAAILPALRDRRTTFMIEDPATVWHLSPDRYSELARRYTSLAPDASRLALDINVVERYQNVYPTKQQTGMELLQLIRASATGFRRTALYFENSILPMDWAWLAVAATSVDRVRRDAEGLLVESSRPLRIQWPGPAKVNGQLWPAGDERTLFLPAGTHQIQQAEGPERVLVDFNGELISATGSTNALSVRYRSDSRAVAVLRVPPAKVRLEKDSGAVYSSVSKTVVLLPSGEHTVTFEFDTADVSGW